MDFQLFDNPQHVGVVCLHSFAQREPLHFVWSSQAFVEQHFSHRCRDAGIEPFRQEMEHHVGSDMAPRATETRAVAHVDVG